MKKNSYQLISATVLSILFFTTLFSLLGVEISPNSGSSSIHAWAGSLLLIVAAIHFHHKIAWIKSVISRSTQPHPKRIRQNRNIDLSMAITGAICASTGLIGLVYPIVQIARVHTISGLLMILLIGIHMLLHWNWMVSNVRQLWSPHNMHGDMPSLERLSMEKNQQDIQRF